jgi:DHA1 family multidrug resistance protein-like MFS transporter
MKKFRQAIYAMQSIDGIAGSLIGIFIPIYFLTLGFTITDIFYFFIANNLAILAFFFAAGWFAKKFGLVQAIFFRLIFKFGMLGALCYLGNSTFLFYLISIFSAIDIAFYWFSLHVIFAKSTDHDAMGEHVGNLSAIPSLAKLPVPIIGAGISALFGFKILFFISGIIFFLSAIPLLFVGSIPVDIKISFSRIMEFTRRFKKYFCSETIISIVGEVEGYILPIFLFLTFNNILSIGALAAFLGLGSAIFMFFVGKFSDKFDKKKILRVGALAMILVWLGRYFATTEIEFYIWSVLAGFFGVLINIPFTSIIYKNAKESHVEDFIIFREIPISLGRALVYAFGVLLVSKVKMTFLLSALSYVYLLFF